MKEEKLKQEVLKTLEQQKELVPVSVLRYFFDFGEMLIQRLYRRPHEIIPQISAFCNSGDDKKAVNLMISSLEKIVNESRIELINAIKEDGLEINADN